MVYIPDEGSVNLQRRRVTDLKQNSKVCLPKPLKVQEEAKLSVRVSHYREEFRKHRMKFCNQHGKQKQNLTQNQQKGLASLRKRIKNQEIVILQTDKTGKFAVTDMETYEKMGEEHTGRDEEITREQVLQIERLINGNMSMLGKCFQIGKQWNHTERCRETQINHSESVAPMYLVVKDHKLVPICQLPKTRPIVSGCRSMGVHLADTLADIVEALATAKGGMENISSEDFLAVLNEYNESLGVEGDYNMEDIALLGFDVISLFPNLDINEVSKEVGKEFLESEVKVEGTDWKELSCYLAMNMTTKEISDRGLRRLVATRAYSKGRRPGCTGEEAKGPNHHEDKKRSSWIVPDIEPFGQEIRRMLATALEIAIKVSFSTYVSSFAGKLFSQRLGGPIGSRLAMAVARVMMIRWGEKVKEVLARSGIKCLLSTLYVDDVRLALQMLANGTRWDSDRQEFCWREEWVLKTWNRMEQLMISKVEYVKMLSSIYRSLNFTVESQ